VALGIALLATRPDDPVELLACGTLAIHLSLTSTLFDRALRLALNRSMGKQIALAITAFGYAILMGSEGVAPLPAQALGTRVHDRSEQFTARRSSRGTLQDRSITPDTVGRKRPLDPRA
jgi:hypothetical protein